MNGKKRFLITTIISLLSVLLILLIIFIINANKNNTLKQAEQSMQNLPNGKFLYDSTSPDGNYLIKVYLCEGSATVDYAIRCELVTKEQKTKNIYWQYKVDKALISWKDNNTVLINDKVIELPDGKYDWRLD